MSGMHLRSLTCVSLRQDEPTRREAVVTAEETLRRCLLPATGQQTDEDKKREEWRRTNASLFSVLEGMPSGARVFEIGSYQHLRRVRRERHILFREIRLSELRFRIRGWVSP